MKDATVNDLDRLAFGQAIARSVAALRDAIGGKAVAGLFDGREGKEVAESTVSRWISEPDRFPAVFLPVLVESSPDFRSYVFQHIAARMTVPSEVMKRMTPKAAEEFSRAAESVILEEAGPGRWVRR